MKVIFINAAEKTVTETEIANGYPDGNRLIGADLITVAGIANNHDLVVDDEGLLRCPRYFFKIKSFYPLPLAGNGFICQATEDGDWISHNLNLDSIKTEIEWFDTEDAGDEFRLWMAAQE